MSFAVATVLAFTTFGGTAFADKAVSSQPVVGEVRVFAVASADRQAIERLHQAGWVEARGELLAASAFPELYGTIGRDWTTDGVEETWFAVPEIRDRLQGQLSSDNPFGVLGPSDLVSGGRVAKPWLKR